MSLPCFEDPGQALKVKVCCCEPCVTRLCVMCLGFVISRGEDFDLGSETRLDYSLYRRVSLKYNRDRESF